MSVEQNVTQPTSLNPERGLRVLSKQLLTDFLRHPIRTTRRGRDYYRVLSLSAARRRRGLLAGHLAIGLPDEEDILHEASDGEVRRALKLVNLQTVVRDSDEKSESRLVRRLADIRSAASIGEITYLEEETIAEPEHAKTLLYIAHDTILRRRNGYCVRTQDLLSEMVRLGWDVCVALRPTGAPDLDETVAGVRYVHKTLKASEWTNWADYQDKFARQIIEIAKDFRPAQIQAASNHICGLSGLKASRAIGRPFHYEVRGLWHITRLSNHPDYQETPGWSAQNRRESQIIRAANGVLTLNTALADRIKTMGAADRTLRLLPNAGRTIEAIKRKPYSNEHFCIGYVGSLVGYEGLADLFRALEKIPEDFPIKLKIYGEGAEGDQLRTLADALPEGRVEFKGRFEGNPETLRAIYDSLDLVVLPRRPDPVCNLVSPLKPYEAAAHGCPLLVSNVAPLAEFAMVSGAAVTFKAGDIESLSEVLQKLILDPAVLKALSDSGLRYVSKYGNWALRASELEAIYKANMT